MFQQCHCLTFALSVLKRLKSALNSKCRFCTVVPWKDSCKLWPDTTAVLLSGQRPCALLLCDGHFASYHFDLWHFLYIDYPGLLHAGRLQRNTLRNIQRNSEVMGAVDPMRLALKLYQNSSVGLRAVCPIRLNGSILKSREW